MAENNEDMWHACRHGDMVKVRECFGAQWRSAVDEEGRTLLHWAVDRDHPDLVQWFLEQGMPLAIVVFWLQKINYYNSNMYYRSLKFI